MKVPKLYKQVLNLLPAEMPRNRVPALLGCKFRLSRQDTKELISEMQEMGLVQIKGRQIVPKKL